MSFIVDDRKVIQVQVVAKPGVPTPPTPPAPTPPLPPVTIEPETLKWIGIAGGVIAGIAGVYLLAKKIKGK